MSKTFFDEDVVKNSRLILCPKCDSETRVHLQAEEIECDDCGECIPVEMEGSYPEEFVWHPSEDY